MKEELEQWLNTITEIYPEITREKMNSLLNRDISSRLYSEIPSNGIGIGHQQKVDYMMNMLEELKQPKEKSKLNLVIANGSSSMEYVEYLSTEFDVNVVNIKNVKRKKDIDLVLFTGGEDVDPELYGEKVGKHTYINKTRDKKERDCFNFFKGYVPMLGVCRGSQLLCVLNGGKLIQHVEGHDREHTIIIDGNSRPVPITSTHHQMVYPFNLKNDKYKLVAYSEFYKSKTYLNGDNKEIELSKDFLEPEIVYYPNTKCLGIQGHPEYESCDFSTKKICMMLIKKYLFSDDEFKKSESYEWEDNYDYVEDEEPAIGNYIHKTKDYKKFYHYSFKNGIDPISSLNSDSNLNIKLTTISKEDLASDPILGIYYSNTPLDSQTKDTHVDKEF
jgi:GMP synthase-like glutamine amidotransferase